MKKKFVVPPREKKEWDSFTSNLEKVNNKDAELDNNDIKKKNFLKLDLHGLSLGEANKSVQRFINKAFTEKCRKLLIVTGKGLRSKVYGDPYRSEKMNVLRYSVPEYIKNNKNLLEKIKKISEADIKDGGEGAFYIFLK